MLPQSSTGAESSVSAGSSACFGEHPEPGGPFGSGRGRYRAWVGGSGSRMTSPSSPSMMAIRQWRARSRNRPRPTTAGISSAAATMAVWLARPPASVAKPSTRRGSSPRRLARREVVGQRPGGRRQLVLRTDLGRWPTNWPRIRGSMSRTSAARAARWESVSRSRRAAWASSTSMTACSAAIRSRLDPRPGIGPQGRVGDHPAVGGQDVGILGTEPVTGLGLGLLGLAMAASRPASSRASSAATASGGDLAGRQPHAARVEHQHRPDRDAGADGDPAQDLHRGRGRRRVAVPGLRMPGAACREFLCSGASAAVRRRLGCSKIAAE